MKDQQICRIRTGRGSTPKHLVLASAHVSPQRHKNVLSQCPPCLCGEKTVSSQKVGGKVGRNAIPPTLPRFIEMIQKTITSNRHLHTYGNHQSYQVSNIPHSGDSTRMAKVRALLSKKNAISVSFSRKTCALHTGSLPAALARPTRGRRPNPPRFVVRVAPAPGTRSRHPPASDART